MNFYLFKDVVLTALLRHFEEVDGWFSKLEALRDYRPQAGGWAIDEILEHIMVTNHYLLILIDKGKEKALKKTEKVDLDSIVYDNDLLLAFEEIGEHKSFPWPRPAHMEPTGNVSEEEVRTTLKQQITQCLETLTLLADGQGTLVKTQMSVNDLGKIDVYGYLYFLALHSKRHVEQMRKIEEEYERNL